MIDDDGYDSDTDQDDDNDGQVTLRRSQIRAMERDAKAARKAQQEAESLRRELAFSRAGISDLTERQQKALLATIEGDITPDTVRATAEELGFVQPAAPAQDAERQQLEQMSAGSAGASDPGSEDSVARLARVAREGGKEALLAQLQADGHAVSATA